MDTVAIIGNAHFFGTPLMGSVRQFRMGVFPSEYEADTLHLDRLGDGFPESSHLSVDELERFFGREGDARMTSNADAFVMLDTDDEADARYREHDSGDGYSRLRANIRVLEIDDGYRAWGGQQDIEFQSTGLSLKLTQLEHGGVAYLDNAHLRMSNILWEFSPDGGRSTWFQLYRLPNGYFDRITLPRPTSQLRARAISNNPDEWIQDIGISILPDWQSGRINQELAWAEGAARIDEYGYVTWPEAVGGHGDIIYSINSLFYTVDSSDEIGLIDIKQSVQAWTNSPIAVDLAGYSEDAPNGLLIRLVLSGVTQKDIMVYAAYLVPSGVLDDKFYIRRYFSSDTSSADFIDIRTNAGQYSTYSVFRKVSDDLFRWEYVNGTVPVTAKPRCQVFVTPVKSYSAGAVKTKLLSFAPDEYEGTPTEIVATDALGNSITIPISS